jgi:NAD(P)H-flavin reductase
MAALFWVFLFFHCDWTLTSWDYLTAAAVMYTVCLATSQLRTWAEHGIAKATLEALPSGAVRIHIPSTSTWHPGQHMFIRFLTWDLHGLTSHPFTICSLPLNLDMPTEKIIEAKNEMTFFIYPRGGMTRCLTDLAHKRAGRPIRVMLDGPYGAKPHKALSKFEQALLIAGGAGAGFTLPLIENYLLHSKPATAGTNITVASTLKVIIAVRTQGELAWFHSAATDLLNLYPSTRNLVHIEIFLTNAHTHSTRNDPSTTTIESSLEKDIEAATPVPVSEPQPKTSITISSTKETQTTSSISSTIDNNDAIITTSDADKEPTATNVNITHYRDGRRPDLQAIVHATASSAVHGGGLGVTVCGPDGMLFDVRQAVAREQIAFLKGERQQRGEVYLHSETFSW